MKAKLFLVFIGLTIGNCLAAALQTDPNFMKAIDISFYEGWALLTYWFCETYVLKE